MRLDGDRRRLDVPEPQSRACVLLLHHVAGGWDELVREKVPTWQPGSYLVDYDPDVGTESLVVSRDRADARVFAHTGDALELWRAVLPSDPVRPDGRPNRPLTGFTVEPVLEGQEPLL